MYYPIDRKEVLLVFGALSEILLNQLDIMKHMKIIRPNKHDDDDVYALTRKLACRLYNIYREEYNER